MITINVKHDLAALEARLRAYPQKLMQAGVRAMNRSATTVRAEGARLMREHYRLPIRAIKKRIGIQYASAQNPRAVVTFTARKFRLTNWHIRQTRGGIILRGPWAIVDSMNRRMPLDTLRRAFLHQKKGRPLNLQHVWIRSGPKRYPIEPVLGAALAEAFREFKVGATLRRIGLERFRTVLAQEMKFHLSGHRGRGL